MGTTWSCIVIPGYKARIQRVIDKIRHDNGVENGLYVLMTIGVPTYSQHMQFTITRKASSDHY